MKKVLDLRSDTVTHPTDAMRDAMRNAEVGDDVIGDDYTVKKLEQMGAKLFGKEDCLFTVSGTMSNQVAVLSMTGKAEQIVVHDNSHMYNLERAGLAQICGVQPRPISTENGKYDLDELEANILFDAMQVAPTSLVCLENTFDLNKGIVLDKDYIDDVCRIAHAHNVPVYMDGARILNAAIALNIEPDKLLENVDAVSLCLSKGLACPIGSLLAGSKEMIFKARRMRQMLGGGWRQAGIIAAAGIVALENWKVLEEDHKKAKLLAKQLKNKGLGIDMEQVQTNIINIDLSPIKMTATDFCQALNEYGILAKVIGNHHVRMICHKDIEYDDIENVAEIAGKVVGA